jgi:TetR/AcrR family transcriptional regulator, transcriptional repressor for nem operon
MRHANQSKAESHSRIVSEASRLMREKGVEGVSVSDVMKASGLTHGGFYAHFDSKDSLAAAAVKEGFREKLDYLNGPDPDALEGYVESFLSEGHVQNLGSGCPIIGFAPDAVKAGEDYQSAVSDGIIQLIDALTKRLGEGDAARDHATRLLAMMIGGVLMARAVRSDKMQSTMINAIRNAPSAVRLTSVRKSQ